jgi:hypothetical protein
MMLIKSLHKDHWRNTSNSTNITTNVSAYFSQNAPSTHGVHTGLYSTHTQQQHQTC